MSDLVVLGSDTDAGKTAFCALWLAAFANRYEYWKPVETGESDTETIRRLVPQALVHDPAAFFTAPVAPPLAARMEGGTSPNAGALLKAIPQTADRLLLIETFGSPLSPLTDSQLQIEFISALRRPTVLVVSSRVGAIGRALQSLDALDRYGIVPSAVLLLGSEDRYAMEQIAKHRPSAPVISLTLPSRWHSTDLNEGARRQRGTLESIESIIARAGDEALPVRDSSVLLTADRRFVWHPYTSLRPKSDPLPVVGAEAEFLQLADGRRVVDAISSWWTILHGHRHPPLMQALRDASERIDHVLFAGVTHPDAVRLAELLLKTTSWSAGRVFFSDNGSTAVEVALKMAYQTWCHRGESQRRLFVAFEHGYHGDTFGAMAVGRDPLFFGRFEPLLFEAAQLSLDANRLDEWLRLRSTETAAIIIEPLVQGAGGMRMHSPQILKDIFLIAKNYGLLVIADEVMTGNRTGRRWAFQHAGVVPDLICAAKTLAGGILPLAATMASSEIVAAFDTDDRAQTFFHGHSFTAHPLACAVGVVNEELVSNDAVHERARAIGRFFESELAPLRGRSGVRDVRTRGSIAAVELDETGGYLATSADAIRRHAIERGVLLRPLGNVVYAMPPLGTSDESLGRIAEVIRSAIGERKTST